MKKFVAILCVIISTLSLGIFTSCGKKTPKPIRNLVDFIVEIDSDRDFVVLQLSDTQIIDSAQKRDADRLDDTLTQYWATENIEDRCFKYVRNVVERSNPDLILITGDIVYGEFDDSGESLIKFIDFMDSFKTPWAVVMGNHDGESKKGIDWICRKLENSKHCLFKQRGLIGNGNYSVGLIHKGKLVRTFFMVDSNGYTNMSSKTATNGHSTSSVGFNLNQISWFSSAIDSIKEKSPQTKISFAWHIPSQSFLVPLVEKYNHNEGTVKTIDLNAVGQSGDFGLINGAIGGVWDYNLKVWDILKGKGVDSIFVGHVHSISASVVYDGIRLQFGQKSSTYDAANYLTEDGKIVFSYHPVGEPIVGGTVIPVSYQNGDISSPYILLYNN